MLTGLLVLGSAAAASGCHQNTVIGASGARLRWSRFVREEARLSQPNLSPMAAAVAAIVGVAIVGGCGDEGHDESVYASAALVVTQGPHPSPPGTWKSANGRYGAGCADRFSGLWSLEIADGATLAHDPLSVVKGNTDCVLILTSLTADKEYMASPAFAMTDGYQANNSAFSLETLLPFSAKISPVAFYGNAYLSSLSFTSDFIAVVLYLDDPNVDTHNNTAIFTVVTASATASGVPAPTYAIDMAPLIVSTDNDDIVQTATGTADLTNGAVIGESYVVLMSLSSTSYADIDAAFNDVANTRTVISGASPQIPAAAFSLEGVDLTAPVKLRYVIIANIVSDAPSYQVFTIAFSPPARTP